MSGLSARLFATLLLTGLAGLGHVAIVAAQDTAEVHITVTGSDGQPADATVILTPEEGGAAQSCRTNGGRCRLAAVPRGRYVVTAAPASEGRPPTASVVWVPPRVSSIDVRVRLR